ncbi:MAG: hypothetical protein DWQ47_10790 [Acidobacteria bacterium]|nr:MAG: hypothetical protein DWQ32_13205 [Acidobacteriota bacterium]REJ98071.1 MAG: hypothetical protein DWQ38_16005 [Acidobacteriota bacterium]REK16814.1 MAG: hypothetical protein DWQ43_01050 [Acidobacteriota bacterium]REK42725.1 MAG: hypothetical protein DWQ47_10790 [Acidobacteriota bacterium]
MVRLSCILLCVLLTAGILIAQSTEKFDIVSYRSPTGWQKEVQSNAIQFGAENAEGGICIITVFKSVPGGENPKENFNAAWEALVKENVSVAGAPQMKPAVSNNGWTAENGMSVYENDGKKGVVSLISITGGGTLVNVLILTNTDYFQETIAEFLSSIDLPVVKTSVQKPVDNPASQPAKKTPTPRASGFRFNESNFDDGWTSTEQEDWVEVVKGNLKVLLHYPKEGTIFPADPEPLTNAAWNILVAPRYSDLKNYRTAYVTTYERPYLGMGYLKDNASGTSKFVVLFRQGNSGWIEFISPDKNGFIEQFKFDPETIRWDSNSELMVPLRQMANYNKFAIAESDFNGTWTSDFTGVQQLYHVYTGNYAGMNINQSNEEFVFGAGNSYSWKLLVVNGMVGNMRYANVNSAGKFTVLNNWQIQFSKIESGAKTYHAYWSCIKGARLLHLLNANSPGSGIYSVYAKK